MSPASLTWLGHATVVLDLDGTRFVTDPVLTRRVVHLWRPAAARVAGDRPDVVLVSHAHWDHLHLASLKRVAAGAVVLVPRGNERLVARFGFSRVVPVGRGDTVAVDGLEVEVTHAEHGASRRGLARVRSEAVGFVIRGSRHVYFAGDTDLFDGMRELAGDLDVALLPVAGWGRNLPEGHLDPGKAVDAVELLEPRSVVPVHWGTYSPFGWKRLGGSRTAAEEFRDEAARRVPGVAVHLLQVGETLELPTTGGG